MSDSIFAILDESGNVTSVVYDPGSTADTVPRPEGCYAVKAPFGVDPVELLKWRYNGEVFVRPATVNFLKFEGGSWIPDPVAAADNFCKEVDKLAEEAYSAPVEFGGVAFDADQSSVSKLLSLQLRVSRGDGLPAGWSGWRAHDNTMHLASAPAIVVGTFVASLITAIEDRNQLVRVAAWAHKDAIRAKSTVEEIASYDFKVGWPM